MFASRDTYSPVNRYCAIPIHQIRIHRDNGVVADAKDKITRRLTQDDDDTDPFTISDEDDDEL